MNVISFREGLSRSKEVGCVLREPHSPLNYDSGNVRKKGTATAGGQLDYGTLETLYQ